MCYEVWTNVKGNVTFWNVQWAWAAAGGTTRATGSFPSLDSECIRSVSGGPSRGIAWPGSLNEDRECERVYGIRWSLRPFKSSTQADGDDNL
jgi:hypothetical protein